MSALREVLKPEPVVEQRPDWGPRLREVGSASTGPHELVLSSDLTAKAAFDLLAQARATGYDGFRIASGDVTVDMGTPNFGRDDLLLLISADGWSMDWRDASGLPTKSVTSGYVSDIAGELTSVLQSTWSKTPCDVTIAATSEASFFSVVAATVAAFRARPCDRRFTLAWYSDPPNLSSLVTESSWTAGTQTRVLTIRVPEPPPRAPGRPVVREERMVRVGGVTERWRIQWRDTPQPVCASPKTWTCPCSQFTYGERGQADLIRSRTGTRDEKFPLASAFGWDLDLPRLGLGEVPLRRWPQETDDANIENQEALLEVIRKRSVTTILDVRDYNHDGWATEFVLPIGGVGCATHLSVLVGVSRRRPKLHVFGSASHPDVPLALRDGAWKMLLDSGGKTTYVDYACGFRGGDTQIEIELRADENGIHGASLEYACPIEPRRLLSRKEF